jgi:hypothetical protein
LTAATSMAWPLSPPVCATSSTELPHAGWRAGMYRLCTASLPLPFRVAASGTASPLVCATSSTELLSALAQPLQWWVARTQLRVLVP